MSEEQPEHQRAAMKVFDEMVSQNMSLRDCIVAVYVAGLAKSTGTKRKRESKPKGTPAPTAAAWEAYSTGYERRYGVKPVRNAAVSGQLAQFVARIPAEEAPMVAAFYLTHKGGLYVSAKHPVNLLLRDAEKLRTDWATNQRQDPARDQGNTETAFQRQRRERMAEMTGGLASKRNPATNTEAFDDLPDTTRIVG